MTLSPILLSGFFYAFFSEIVVGVEYLLYICSIKMKQQLNSTETMTNLTPSNKPTAKLRMKILQYVCEYDYYPNDWFSINELEKQLLNDEITVFKYYNEIEKLSENWK